MNTWTIQKRIAIGFGILTFLTALVGITGFASVNLISTQIDRLLNKDMPGAIMMCNIKDGISQAYAYVERHIRTTDPEAMREIEAKYVAIYNKNQALFDHYEKDINTSEDRQLFTNMQIMTKAYGTVRLKLFELSTHSDKADAIAYMNSTFLPEYRNYRALVEDYVQYNIKQSENRGAMVSTGVKASSSFIISGMILAIVLAIIIGIVISKQTSRILRRAITTIDEGSSQVAAASAQVSSASSMLAEGASEQAASLEETSSSLEEMSSMTAHNAESAKQAKSLADEMRTAADDSSSQMQEMQQAMDAIKSSSAGISQIIKTIDEIAFQTNILALNAAVEAARAGEAGAGFAIVAEEVRNLAQRSANSAKETSVKIEGAVRNSEHGVVISSRVATSLSSIVNKARSMNHLVGEIATATEEQDKGISQLSIAVSQMDKVTQSNASNAEETASASEELNAHADTLKDTVGDLISLIQKSNKQNAELIAGNKHLRIGMGQEHAPRLDPHSTMTLSSTGMGRTLTMKSSQKDRLMH